MRAHRSRSRSLSPENVRRIDWQYALGSASYTLSFFIAFAGAIASVVFDVLLAALLASIDWVRSKLDGTERVAGGVHESVLCMDERADVGGPRKLERLLEAFVRTKTRSTTCSDRVTRASKPKASADVASELAPELTPRAVFAGVSETDDASQLSDETTSLLGEIVKHHGARRVHEAALVLEHSLIVEARIDQLRDCVRGVHSTLSCAWTVPWFGGRPIEIYLGSPLTGDVELAGNAVTACWLL